MTAHRELQRTLFRMQADASFARAIFAAEPDALATTGLAADDLALLTAVDPRAVRADPGGKRRAQIAGNATSEYLLTLAVAARDGGDFLNAFLAAPEFHAALAANGRLPLAFGDFAARYAQERADAPLAALVALEHGMASLRRAARRPGPAPKTGDMRLSAAARTLELPSGTLAWSVALRAALDAGRAATLAELSAAATETVLLHLPEGAELHRLADVRLELLEPPADALMRRAANPLSPEERAAFARAHGAEPADLEAFLTPFIDEGVLVAGSG